MNNKEESEGLVSTSISWWITTSNSDKGMLIEKYKIKEKYNILQPEIVSIWMQEVVRVWWVHEKKLEQYPEQWGSLSTEATNEIALLYLKEHTVKEESGTKDGVLSLPGVFANHPRCVPDERELIQELTNAASSVSHLLRTCLDDTLPPVQEWIRIRKEYIEFLTPYIEKGERYLSGTK